MLVPVIFLVVVLFVLLASGLWVGLSLLATGIGALSVFRSMPIDQLLGQGVWNNLTSPELIALPLFILMGEMLHFTRAGEMLFKGLAPWLVRVPGGLLHVNVVGSLLFAAMSGSSAATAATVGRITIPELLSRGYGRSLVLGSLAGAGTLGFLIPPSIPLIIYGILADTSILQLFIAGIVPGLLLAALYSGYIMVVSIIRPAVAPRSDAQSMAGLWESSRELFPLILLISAVIGSMYTGIASPTEAAAVGVCGAIVLALWHRTITLQRLFAAGLAAVSTTSMIALIIVGAVFLSVAAAFLGVPQFVARSIAALDLSPLQLVALLIVFYVALGCVLDGLSILVMTLPITLPLVEQAGFDKIWFGIFLVVVIEIAQITPPVGFNLFVLNSLTRDSISRITAAVFPFFLILSGFALLIGAVPQIISFGLGLFY